jgi:hypothetical protein
MVESGYYFGKQTCKHTPEASQPLESGSSHINTEVEASQN